MSLERPPSLEAQLVSEACNFYGVNEADLHSPQRGYYTKVRWAVAYVLTEHCGWSENRTAKFLKKHHRAIQDGNKQAQKLLRTDPLFFEIVERLRKMICSI